MLSLLVFLAGIAFQPTAPSSPVSQAPLAHFRIVLERTSSGTVAQCETGCNWKELSFQCAADCRMPIDANGVGGNPEGRPSASPFAFRLRPTSEGWSAESVRGTAWVSLSLGCVMGSCRAQVDEFGVRGLGPR
jgi:hypothetical protein